MNNKPKSILLKECILEVIHLSSYESIDLFFNDELAVITRLCYSTRYYISKMVASDHVIIHKKI